jgi:hypothetical protein
MVFAGIDNVDVFRFNSDVFQTKPGEMKAFCLVAITAINHDNHWECFWTAFSAVVAVLAFFWAVLERISRMRTDKKLDEIKRRGDAPFFCVCESAMWNIAFYRDGGVEYLCAATEKSILSFQHGTVEALHAGDPVILLVDDAGEPTHEIVVKLDDDPIIFGSAIEHDTAKKVLFLKYPYDPQKQGKEQRIIVSFETRSGVHNTHTYLTLHGVRFLKRIDPPLPQ